MSKRKAIRRVRELKRSGRRAIIRVVRPFKHLANFMRYEVEVLS